MIKWEDIKIRVSGLTNNIYMGKVNKAETFTDKSGDITKECVLAVFQHMQGEAEVKKVSEISFNLPRIGKLTFVPVKEG